VRETGLKGAIPLLNEVNDIIQAVASGIDCLVLSHETAVGDFFEESIYLCRKIVEEAERQIDYQRQHMEQQKSLIEFKKMRVQAIMEKVQKGQIHTLNYNPEQWNKDECISSCSVKASFDVNAKLIVVLTHSGNTAIRVRTHQPKATIIAVTQNESTVQRLTVVAGVYPFLVGSILGQ
jgi:pyruvate kinase